MHKFAAALVCGAILMVQLPGCGGASSTATPVNVEQINKPKSSAALKAKLEEIAKSGEGGSATAGLRTAIQEFENKEVAAELMKDLAKLESTSNKDEIKATAARMAAKL